MYSRNGALSHAVNGWLSQLFGGDSAQVKSQPVTPSRSVTVDSRSCGCASPARASSDARSSTTPREDSPRRPRSTGFRGALVSGFHGPDSNGVPRSGFIVKYKGIDYAFAVEETELAPRGKFSPLGLAGYAPNAQRGPDMRRHWYRGGDAKPDATWYAASRSYAAFCSDKVFELKVGDRENILDVRHIGVVADADELERLELPTGGVSRSRPNNPDLDTSYYVHMYAWAERNWPALARLGYTGVALRQEHADYGDDPEDSLLFWGGKHGRNVTGYAPNGRPRGPAMREGDDDANRRRGTSGRFQKSTMCDFCGRSCAAEHFTDDRLRPGSDGPGFYLCGRVGCVRAREKLEAAEGFEALAEHYVQQREKNDAVGREPAHASPMVAEEAEQYRVERRARRTGHTTNGPMTFEEAKRHKQHLEAENRAYSDALKEFPKGPMGITPDSVRATAEWQAANSAYHRSFRSLRDFNEQYVKLFRSELAAERRAKRGGYTPNATVYDMTNVDADVANALDHMSDEVLLDPGDVETSEPFMIPIGDLETYDDVAGWLELDAGADKRELSRFRGSDWASRAATWTTPQRMPPIIIVQTPQASAIADGRGRVNYAVAMGWSEIPAIVVTPRGHTPNATVYYVWLLDYRDVPIDEGPYGPYNLTAAKDFARIGATQGDHDRAVSVGRDPDRSGFEIVRRYRRGTGEQML